MPDRSLDQFLVRISGEGETLFVICILHQVEEDEGFGIIRVKALIVGGVILFEEDHGVFPAADIHVRGKEIVLPVSEDMRRESVRLGRGCGIDMDGDEKIGIISVGYGRPVVQGHEYIRGSGVYDLDIRIGCGNPGAEFFRYVEIYVLFIDFPVAADATGVMASVTGIYDHSPEPEAVVTGSIGLKGP